LDVREPHGARARRRLHAAFRGRHLREGPRPRARHGAREEISAAARGGRAPDVPPGERRRIRPRGRRGGDQDLSGDRLTLSRQGRGTASMTPLRLGCIADDSTGATDVANNLVRGGMRVVQTIGVPEAPLEEEVDAVVVALKSRTCPAKDAVAQSLAALEWLRRAGARQIYFKYCSTFDSTPRGNIGPVTDALMSALGTDFTISCPAFPENKR